MKRPCCGSCARKKLRKARAVLAKLEAEAAASKTPSKYSTRLEYAREAVRQLEEAAGERPG